MACPHAARRLALALGLALAAGADAAPGAAVVSGRTPVYRWTDAAGIRHYASEPPEPGAVPVALPPLQVYRADTPEALLPAGGLPGAGGSPAAPVAVAATARLSSPADGQVFLAGSALEVAAEVRPALPKAPGGVIFELDGRPLTREPQPDRVTLATPAPGEHRLLARVVDAQGRTTGTSAPVRFVVQAVPVEAVEAFLQGPGGR